MKWRNGGEQAFVTTCLRAYQYRKAKSEHSFRLLYLALMVALTLLKYTQAMV